MDSLRKLERRVNCEMAFRRISSAVKYKLIMYQGCGGNAHVWFVAVDFPGVVTILSDSPGFGDIGDDIWNSAYRATNGRRGEEQNSWLEWFPPLFSLRTGSDSNSIDRFLRKVSLLGWCLTELFFKQRQNVL